MNEEAATTAKLQRLPISLPELVESSPSLTQDGSVVLGKRTTQLFCLDAATGALIRAVRDADAIPGLLAGSDDELEDTMLSEAGLSALQLVDLSDAVLLGREDYVVRSVQVATGAELWNASYSRIVQLSPPTPGTSGPVAGSLGGVDAASSGAAPAAPKAPSGLPLFRLGADHTLQAYDPVTSYRRWAISFDAPPVGVFSSSGSGLNYLDPRSFPHAHPADLGHGSCAAPPPQSPPGRPGPGLAGGPTPAAPAVPGRACPRPGGGGGLPVPVGGSGGAGGGDMDGGRRVMVGVLRGSLYALPADHVLLDERIAPQPWGSIPIRVAPSPGRRPALPALPAAPIPSSQSPATASPARVDDLPKPAFPGVKTQQELDEDEQCSSEVAGSPDDAVVLPGSGTIASGGTATSKQDVVTVLSEDEGGTDGPGGQGSLMAGGLVCPLGMFFVSPGQPGEASGHDLSWLPKNKSQGGGLNAATSKQQQRLPGLSADATLLGILTAPGALLAALTGVIGVAAGAVAVVAVWIMRRVADRSVRGYRDRDRSSSGRDRSGSVRSTGGGSAVAAGGNGSAAGGADVSVRSTRSSVKDSSVHSNASTSSNGGSVRGGNKNTKAAARSAATAASAAAAADPTARVVATAANGGNGNSNGGGGRSAGTDDPGAPANDEYSGIDENGMLGTDNDGDASVPGSAGGSPSKSPGSKGGSGKRRSKAAKQAAAPVLAAGGSLIAIDEDAQLTASDDIGMPPRVLDAMTLPSAETRVRVMPDGSISIGRLSVGPNILGYGSAGTVVYDGVMDGRPVAVKRLLRQFYDLARKEIEVLILSDEHPNVVRCFAMEEDREFVYLALEKCKATLADHLAGNAGKDAFLEGTTAGNGSAGASASGSGRATAAAGADASRRLPTSTCMSVMFDIVSGLQALHERGIVHRDLKPHNVLLTEAGRAKLSDMGLCRQLVAEQSSFESHGAGGSSGWQAPEQLIARDGGAARQTRSMDVFSLGCVLYYCMTGGRHPFGDHYERDNNILHSAPCLELLAGQPEAQHLIAAMLHKDPARRPAMAAVAAHPLWWSDEKRLQFLMDISDRVEGEDREVDQSLLSALEAVAGVAHGANWGAVMPPELITNLGKYRRYDFTSLRDLLRVIRNKRSHFREMPLQLQEIIGPPPVGFLRFFTSRFPHLLLAAYCFGLHNVGGEALLQHYWPSTAACKAAFVQTFCQTYKAAMRTVLQASPSPQRQPATSSAAASATATASSVSAPTSGVQQAAFPSPARAQSPAVRGTATETTIVSTSSTDIATRVAGGSGGSRNGSDGASASPTVDIASGAASSAATASQQSAAPAAPVSPGPTTPAAASEASQSNPVADATTAAAAGVPSSSPASSTANGLPVLPADIPGSAAGASSSAVPTAAAGTLGRSDRLDSVSLTPSIASDGSSTSTTAINTNARSLFPVLPPPPPPPPPPPVVAQDNPNNELIPVMSPSGGSGRTYGLASPYDMQLFAGMSTGAGAYPQQPQQSTGVPPPPPQRVVVGYEPLLGSDEGDVHVMEFPKRPGKQVCDFFMKTGHCKFGDSCVFDHPEQYAVKLTSLGLPLRPDMQLCSFYLKHNECRFGPACKFHHPYLRPIYAGSGTIAVVSELPPTV